MMFACALDMHCVRDTLKILKCRFSGQTNIEGATVWRIFLSGSVQTTMCPEIMDFHCHLVEESFKCTSKYTYRTNTN